MSKIKTMQGDTWDLLSFRAYGTAAYMHRLIEANPAHRRKAILPGGLYINVPEIDTAAEITNESIPPWKRGK